jgi:hypothetical protein
MPGIGIIRAFLEQATAKGTRATVLKPLSWMMAILISATLSAFWLKTPYWLGVTFAMFTGLTMLLYLFTYIYCLFKDKDALRSETYSIQKLAMEKGFFGDDIIGRLKPAEPVGGYIENSTGNESEVEK